MFREPTVDPICIIEAEQPPIPGRPVYFWGPSKIEDIINLL